MSNLYEIYDDDGKFVCALMDEDDANEYAKTHGYKEVKVTGHDSSGLHE